MSEENVEVVRRFSESQSPSEFFELLDPYVVWINYASAPETKPYIGHEGVLQWRELFRADFDHFRVRATEIIDAGGDQVVTVNQMSGIGRSSGAAIEREFASVMTLLNGKIVRVQGFETPAQALEAAGLKS